MRSLTLLIASFLFLTVSVAIADVRETQVNYSHGATPLIGYVYEDGTQSGLRPGVIVFSDWMGLGSFGKERGKQLAALGYTAFVADIYGNGKLTTDPKEAAALSGQFKANRPLTRARANAAFNEFLKNPRIDRTQIGAIGFCFGGLVALELVRSGTPLSGIVSFHGALDTPPEFRAKKLATKVLALHGAEDPFVPDSDIAAFENEMRNSGANWELVKYGGAVHAFTNPNAGSDPSKGAAYNPIVAKRAYLAMSNFFKEIFGK